MKTGHRPIAVTVALLVSICTALGMDAGAAGALAARPESVISKRIRILPAERYRQLRDEWTAYTRAHPADAAGWLELAKAARYAGTPCEEYLSWARKAVELAPTLAEAHAVLGAMAWTTYCPSAPADPASAIAELTRALELDPTRGEPHFSLWVMRLSQGDREGAEEHLRALIETRALPEPVVDFGHNLLAGLEPDAILLTNGDNDTYPVLALQAARGVRRDVTVVNLSLLNTLWYRRELRAGAAPLAVPLLESEADGPQEGPALQGLVQALRSSGWKRPLYLAITVPPSRVSLPNRRSLEGLVYRVLSEEGSEPAIDLPRLEQNLGAAYRLESATSLGLDWKYANALGPLMMNYAVARAHLAAGLAAGGRIEPARAQMSRAMELCEFHDCADFGGGLIEGWRQWDPDGSELKRWAARIRK